MIVAALPPKARAVIQSYVREKLLGNYGHPRKSVRKFQAKLDLSALLPESTLADLDHSTMDRDQDH